MQNVRNASTNPKRYKKLRNWSDNKKIIHIRQLSCFGHSVKIACLPWCPWWGWSKRRQARSNLRSNRKFAQRLWKTRRVSALLAPPANEGRWQSCEVLVRNKPCTNSNENQARRQDEETRTRTREGKKARRKVHKKARAWISLNTRKSGSTKTLSMNRKHTHRVVFHEDSDLSAPPRLRDAGSNAFPPSVRASTAATHGIGQRSALFHTFHRVSNHVRLQKRKECACEMSIAQTDERRLRIAFDTKWYNCRGGETRGWNLDDWKCQLEKIQTFEVPTELSQDLHEWIDYSSLNLSFLEHDFLFFDHIAGDFHKRYRHDRYGEKNEKPVQHNKLHQKQRQHKIKSRWSGNDGTSEKASCTCQRWKVAHQARKYICRRFLTPVNADRWLKEETQAWERQSQWKKRGLIWAYEWKRRPPCVVGERSP